MFSAKSKNTNSIVAIKKLKRDFISHDVEKEGDLLRECRSDFIVSVLDCYITESEVWVASLAQCKWDRLSWSTAILGPSEASSKRKEHSKRRSSERLWRAAYSASIICTSRILFTA